MCSVINSISVGYEMSKTYSRVHMFYSTVVKAVATNIMSLISYGFKLFILSSLILYCVHVYKYMLYYDSKLKHFVQLNFVLF